MATVNLIPSTVSAYPHGTTKSIIYATSDAYAIPTTQNVYKVRYPKEGKTGLAVSMLAASSLNALRVIAMGGQSTDGAWAAPKDGSTTYYTLGFCASGVSTAVSTLYFIPLPPSAEFAQQSTVNTAYNTVNIMIEGSTAPGTTGSTTLATVATTIAMYVFEMP